MEIGMGGTVAKLIDAGANLSSLILTDGRRGPNHLRLQPEELAALRKEEAKKAASILGIHETTFCDLTDLKTEDNYKAAIQQIRKQIESKHIAEIFTLHPDLDRHPTHQLAGKAVLRSFLAASSKIVVWAYEVWGLFARWERLEDITATFDRKMRAIAEHKSQVESIPYGEGVAGLNRWRGVFSDPGARVASYAYAEVFLRLR
jgi:LmbE family N-acetylglucosaminyl deacetylase